MRAPAPEAPVDRWPAPPAFDEYVRSRHAELLRFAHVLCGDPHLAAINLHVVFYRRQAKASPLTHLLGREERLKNVCPHFLAHAEACVADR